MKVAITADLHLTTQDQNPERFQAFSDILQQCGDIGVDALIIAGDLFDKDVSNFADFELVHRKYAPKKMITFIIPGNHDVGLTDSAITLDNIHVYTETTLVDIDPEIPFLLVPYLYEVTMGEEIAKQKDQLKPDGWVLIGHGDWGSGNRQQDPYEKGVYMPLAGSDISVYRPLKAFLGHIHSPLDSDVVHYVGSPCPMKISEIGRRRFIIYDTESHSVTTVFVNNAWINFVEHFIIIPIENEVEYLRGLIGQRIIDWNLPEECSQKVVIKVTVTGYTTNRSEINKTVRKEFERFSFYDDGGPILETLEQNNDPDKAYLAESIKRWIDELDWEAGNSEPTKDEIMVQALRTIYGVR